MTARRAVYTTSMAMMVWRSTSEEVVKVTEMPSIYFRDFSVEADTLDMVAASVVVPADEGPDTIYGELLLKISIQVKNTNFRLKNSKFVRNVREAGVKMAMWIPAHYVVAVAW